MSYKRILTSKLSQYVGQEVEVQGWLHKKREISNKLIFLVLRDRSGLVQVIVDKTPEILKLLHLQPGSVLAISGLVVSEMRAPGLIEIHHSLIKVVVPVFEVSPIEIDKPISHEPEHYDTLFEYRVLGLRSPKEGAVFKIQAEIYKAIRQYLDGLDFTEFRSPKLLSEATEGGAETFALNYFDKTATLAQSAQFYKQIMVGVFERVYEIGATYRAEPSYTTRHMTEFTTLDVEMGFINCFEEVLEVAENLLREVAIAIWKSCPTELKTWKAVEVVLSEKIPRISLEQVHHLYLQNTGINLCHEPDPSPEEERWICEYSTKEWGSEAIFITEFPSSHKKFYHLVNAEKPEVCERADLIFRGVEIATLSQREHRYLVLLEQLKSIGGDPENPGYKYYLQAFKHGLPPHGGFGLGIERLTQKLLGLKSVKEASLFPRDVNRLGP
ncbi:MAG: aspartate--tRNA(Asn) ligase [Patescibacteria group bacterium]